MAGVIIKGLAVFLFGVLAIMGAIYGSVAWTEGVPASDHPAFGGDANRVLVIAHRGGAGIAPENTIYAFRRALDLGADVLELDARATSDGVLVVFHDANVERTTDGVGRVSDMTLAELKRLDAAYRFSPDGGGTFPMRASGVSVPTLEEVFDAFPKARFNIEPKQATPSLAEPLCRLVRERKMTDRVVVGSFSGSIIEDFRGKCGEVATSASPSEVGKFLTMYKSGLSESFSPAMHALQIPENLGGLPIVTKEFVAAARARNLKVHVWTVNDTEAMRRLVEAGVDGIMTDYPDRLLTLLGRAQGR